MLTQKAEIPQNSPPVPSTGSEHALDRVKEQA